MASDNSDSNMKKKAGTVCSATACANKQYSTSNTSFFRFPTDPQRSKYWALACNRKDLLEKGPCLSKSYRLCGEHFENHMFIGPSRKRLKSNAMPTLFTLQNGRRTVKHRIMPTFIQTPVSTNAVQNGNEVIILQVEDEEMAVAITKDNYRIDSNMTGTDSMQNEPRSLTDISSPPSSSHNAPMFQTNRILQKNTFRTKEGLADPKRYFKAQILTNANAPRNSFPSLVQTKVANAPRSSLPTLVQSRMANAPRSSLPSLVQRRVLTNEGVQHDKEMIRILQFKNTAPETSVTGEDIPTYVLNIKQEPQIDFSPQTCSVQSSTTFSGNVSGNVSRTTELPTSDGLEDLKCEDLQEEKVSTSSNADHNINRLCGDDSEGGMFMDDSNDSLFGSQPTLFHSVEPPAPQDTSACPFASFVKKEEIEDDEVKMFELGDVTVTPGTVEMTDKQQCKENDANDAYIKQEPQSPTCLSPASSPTQTTLTKSDSTLTISRLRASVLQLHEQNKLLNKKIKSLEQHLKDIEYYITFEEYQRLTHKFCKSADLANFINMLVLQDYIGFDGKPYSIQFKMECLALYYAGPYLYKKKLMKKCRLPSPAILYRVIKDINLQPGLNNEQLFSILQKKVECFCDKDKFCALSIGSMRLKANLFYSINRDTIIGLTGFDDDGIMDLKPATNALVLTIQGVFHEWKQPIAYYFSSSTHNAESMKEIIWKAVRKLTNIGLRVCALTSVVDTNYIELSKSLKINEDKPYFYIDEQKIIYVFDVLHLFKMLRNTLLKYDFVSDGNIISWKYIKDFYEQDKKESFRIAPILCDSHIYSNRLERTNIKFATQFFNTRVSSSLSLFIRFGALPEEAKATAQFLDFMEKLFDLLNSSEKNSTNTYNGGFKGLDHQVDLLKDCLTLFRNLRVNDSNGCNITSKIKNLKYFRHTINAILSLWEILKCKKFDYILTRRVNQNCLNTFFSNIRRRSKNCTNPTPNQFQRCFKNLLRSNLFHSGIKNCQSDSLSIILRLGNIPGGPVTSLPEKKSAKSPFLKIDVEYRSDKGLRINYPRYICGYLLKKALDIHSCNICIRYSRTYENSSCRALSVFYKAYENDNPDSFEKLNIIPHDNFIRVLTCAELIFQKYFEGCIFQEGILMKLYNISMSTLKYKHPCSKFPFQYVIKLNIRIKLYYALTRINKGFKNVNNNKAILWRH